MHFVGLSETNMVLAFLASLAAGTIDSIAGGGGLILLPSIFSLFPNLPPATLLGSNKIASFSGTFMASVQYSRRVRVNWQTILPAAVFACMGSVLGAWAVTHVDGSDLRKALPFVLTVVFLYTLVQKNFGISAKASLSSPVEKLCACAVGGVLGFYDGFFGPGTGSFFMFFLVRVLGYDFLMASAAAKILNTASNFAAILLFAFDQHIWWTLGLLMAVANISGSLIGTRLAVKHGAKFVRTFFIIVVGALILNNAYRIFTGA